MAVGGRWECDLGAESGDGRVEAEQFAEQSHVVVGDIRYDEEGPPLGAGMRDDRAGPNAAPLHVNFDGSAEFGWNGDSSDAARGDEDLAELRLYTRRQTANLPVETASRHQCV
ncbi:hypothetical protein ABZW96_34330 [Nocardia sp. NPDC004168]|uniref:hypothetical protein n=1 Tax=Nocardia sp. NPDC004168 TaxID=3154452 RepID=UPI0033B57675